MIKVIQKNNFNFLDINLKEMKVNDLIILELQFEKEHFSLPTELQIIKLNKNNLTGVAKIIYVRKNGKTFNKYDKFYNQTISFKYSDIYDILILN